MNETDPHLVINRMLKIGPVFAEAKKDRIQLMEFRKSKKAILMQQAPAECKTDKAKESYAYAHEEYQEVLKGIGEAVFTEEKYRMEMAAHHARIEVWRTEQSNNRVQLGAGGLVT